MNVLSLDLGYGSTKYCISNGKDFSIGKFNSGVCEVPTEGTFGEISNSVYHEFEGKRYFLFDLASKLDIDPINLMTYDGYKKAAPIIITYLLKKFNAENITNIAIGLSPGVWDHKDDFYEYVLNKLQLTKEQMSIHLQGISGHHTYYRFGLDITEFKSNLDIKSQNYIGIDIGHNTIDTYNCIDGEVLDYGIKGMMEKGICIVSNNIKLLIKENYGIDINDVEAKTILSTKAYKRRGKSDDLSQHIESFVFEYLTNTIDLVEKEYAVQLNRCDNIFIFGGGAEIIKNTIITSERLKAKLDELYGKDFLLMPKVNSEYYNSIGYCLLSIKAHK